MIVDTPKMVSVGHGREGAIKRQNFEPVTRQIEFANDLGPQQRNNVGADRKLEAGKNFFGAGGTANDVAPFEDEHFLARFRQIGCVNQAVVATTDDDGVILSRCVGRHSVLNECLFVL